MTDDATRPSPPKEGSNRGHDTNHQRASIGGTMSSPYPKDGSHHEDDGLPTDVETTEGENDIPQPDTSERKPQE